MAAQWRSLLFVPAQDSAKIVKALRAGADAVILDLEDGVAQDAKPAARDAIAHASGELARAGSQVVVRINAKWTTAIAALRAAIGPNVDAIMPPKVESATRVAVLAEIISDLEEEAGIATGAMQIVPLLESSAAIFSFPLIAAAPRVAGLALGSEDFSRGLGVDPTGDVLDLPCRAIAIAAAAGGVSAFAIPMSIAAHRDDSGMRAAAERARVFGVTGALCIHPRQVAIANAVFRATADEIARAEAVIEAWTAAKARGDAVTTLSGMMIDRPVAARAARTLARR
ncbi:CoA ester lyase [Sphingomonas sp. AR_OL41]|uniref:HpcH/HpaI aldolase/citrate lyase family protein n=1 Tax=Sphingomonas sp. AR_OL41 TaxID=3042729 RepID=UPI00247FC5D2|nr:CoA ester lyase [Sphingomonas sp. AR_OL41]MDH7973215.1 CoA ester lyase [Sphingomonas sp. AR_OL41]